MNRPSYDSVESECVITACSCGVHMLVFPGVSQNLRRKSGFGVTVS